MRGGGRKGDGDGDGGEGKGKVDRDREGEVVETERGGGVVPEQSKGL